MQSNLPLAPDWFFACPSGNPTSYDGTNFLDSGPLYTPDAGRTQSFAVTFMTAGTFPYVDVEYDALLEMQGTIVVTRGD